MVTEIHDGIPVTIPRQGSGSYPPDVRKLIAGLPASLRKRYNSPNATINDITVIRVRRDRMHKPIVHYHCSVSVSFDALSGEEI